MSGGRSGIGARKVLLWGHRVAVAGNVGAVSSGAHQLASQSAWQYCCMTTRSILGEGSWCVVGVSYWQPLELAMNNVQLRCRVSM